MDDAAPALSEPPARDWALLPLDVLASIFVRIGAADVLMGAQLVCRSWLEAAKLPEVWRAVDMEHHNRYNFVMRAMAKTAVDRSNGQLRMFAGRRFVTHELLRYIIERSPLLTSLRLVSCENALSERLVNAIRESPFLELRSLELEYSRLNAGQLSLSDVLEGCPRLELLLLSGCFMISTDDLNALFAKFARITTVEHNVTVCLFRASN